MITSQQSELMNSDYDLYAALHFNDHDDVIKRFVTTLAFIEGEYDGAEYHWIVQLDQPDEFAYINGACDYTGWDCRSYCQVATGQTIAEVLALVPNQQNGSEIAAELAGQIKTNNVRESWRNRTLRDNPDFNIPIVDLIAKNKAGDMPRPEGEQHA